MVLYKWCLLLLPCNLILEIAVRFCVSVFYAILNFFVVVAGKGEIANPFSLVSLTLFPLLSTLALQDFLCTRFTLLRMRV